MHRVSRGALWGPVGLQVYSLGQSQDTRTEWRPPGKGRARLTEIRMSKLLEVRE